MLFHTLCFTPLTLKHNPEHNEYVYMLMLLVETLRRTKTYVPGRDQFVVMTDRATLPIIQQIRSLQDLNFVVMPRVSSVYEGMRWKYMLDHVISLVNQTVCYVDVDHLSVRPFTLSLDPDSLALYPEGKPDDTNYCGKSTTPLLLPSGFSAGFFAYSYGPKVAGFFKDVLKSMSGQHPPYWYTLDQPHFNRTVEQEVAKGGPLHMLSPDMISFNGHGSNDKCALISLAGEPGNGSFHLRKMMDMFMALTRPTTSSHPAPQQTTSALRAPETHQLLA